MRLAIVIALYLMASSLTGGYYYNHRCGDTNTCGGDSVIVGYMWPVYWLGRFGIEVTK